MASATSKKLTSCTMPTLFSTDGLPAADRDPAYRDWMGTLGTFERLEVGASESFKVVQTGTAVNDLFLVRERCTPMRTAVVRTRRHASAVDHWVFALQLRGHTSTRSGDATALKTPGTLSVRCLGQTGTLDLAQSRSDTLWLLVPRDALSRASETLERLDGRTLDGPIARVLADHIAAVARNAAGLSAADLAAVGRATTALIEACIGGVVDAAMTAAPLVDGARRRKVAAFLTANLSDPRLSPSFLMDKLGISRSALYRLFEDDGGVMEYVLEERLRRAYEALMDPADQRPVHEIATQHGFSSPEYFSRAFRRRFGCTPRNARAGVPPEQGTIALARTTKFAGLARALHGGSCR